MNIREKLSEWRAKRRAKRIARNMQRNLQNATIFMRTLADSMKQEKENDEKRLTKKVSDLNGKTGK